MMPEGKRTPAQWLKFANSLRLRLAMRVSNVAPELAENRPKQLWMLPTAAYWKQPTKR